MLDVVSRIRPEGGENGLDKLKSESLWAKKMKDGEIQHKRPEERYQNAVLVVQPVAATSGVELGL